MHTFKSLKVPIMFDARIKSAEKLRIFVFVPKLKSRSNTNELAASNYVCNATMPRIEFSLCQMSVKQQ